MRAGVGITLSLLAALVFVHCAGSADSVFSSDSWSTPPGAGIVPETARLLYAPHREGRRFFNPWRKDPKTAWGVLRWWFFDSNPYDKSGPFDVPVAISDGAYLEKPEATPSLTWVGHATYVVHDGDDVFMTDPHFTKRAMIPARNQPPGLPITAIPAETVIK